jgi:ferredoxin--NADP+ reductase
VEESHDPTLLRKLELLQTAALATPMGRPRKLTLRFLVSPVQLRDNAAGEVVGVKLVRNALRLSEDGSLRPRPTQQFEELSAQMVFRSVGYRGVPLADLPFDDARGIVPNRDGRIVAADGAPQKGLYVSGWIKRGPSGVIGTNKPCAAETVERMAEDAVAGSVLAPPRPAPAASEDLVRQRQPRVFTLEAWRRLDALEVQRGKRAGRPRVKLTGVDEMWQAVAGD